jgi:glycosyltransferase involved in cell wall biosynthesis
MNILLVNHHAGGPRWGMEHRGYQLAREWVRTGHQVTIAAASYAHLRHTQPDVKGVVVDEMIDGIRYRWYPTPPYRGNGFARLANIRAFVSGVRAEAAQLAGRVAPDVVIASSTHPFDVEVAGRIAKASGALLVWEVHDLWALSLVELERMSRVNPFVWWCAAAERAAFRDADLVVSMLPKVHEHFRSRGLDPAKLHVVPNGVDPEEWQLGSGHRGAPKALPLRDDLQAALDRARAKRCAIVGYAGAMGRPNALEVLVDAAAQLKGERWAFVMLGDGPERERLLQRARAAQLASMIFLPPVPKAQIPGFLRSIDIAYIGWRRSPLYRLGIAPNKLMDYMMAGCAVLHSVDAGNDPVRDADCGLSVEPEDPKAVARGLRQLAMAGPDERAAMGRRGHAFVMANHAWPVLAERFLDAVRTSARGRRLDPVEPV